MRTEEEILADARPGYAFSNSSSFERWSDQWCARGSGCVHDQPDATPPVYCNLIGVALLNPVTPKEWQAADERAEVFSDYTCTEYDEIVATSTEDGPETDEDPDAAYAEPNWRPVEVLPTQEGLF